METVLSDLVGLVGAVGFVMLMIIMGYFIASKVFKDQPMFKLAVVLSEITAAFFVFANPWLLFLFGFMFSVIIVLSTFASSVFLSLETLYLGIPSMIVFTYSIFDHQNQILLQFISAGLFFIGIMASLLRNEPLLQMVGNSIPAFAFSLAIVGTFLIPSIFPQFGFVNQIVEVIGTVIGLILRR